MRRAGLLNDSSLPFTVQRDEKLLFIFEPDTQDKEVFEERVSFF